MILIKTPDQISKIRDCGRISSKILNAALKLCKPGISTIDINMFIEKKLQENDSISWFKEVNNYPYATCISANDVWVHGMPSEYKLREGDIVSIDLGVKKNGYYVDHCWTIPVHALNTGNSDSYLDIDDSKVKLFLETGIKALDAGISEFKIGNRIGDISYAMQKVIEDKEYSVIKEYTGHGVGLKNHEEPHIPCYGTRGAGALLKQGMVFAIEIMYAMGNPEITVLDDGWSVTTLDHRLSGMYEHTVALTEAGPEILTI